MSLSGCSYPIRNLNSPGETIVCFGDSITYGAGAGRNEDFPSLLSSLIAKDVINAGVSGDTTGSALGRIDRDVLSNNPYLVVVELGGNDFLMKISKQRTMDNLKEIISKIQSKL